MKANLFRADTSYEAFFRQPLLDRPSGVQAPLQSVYDALSEQFTITVADVQVNQSAIVAQTSVIYNLFNGAGSIELRPDRWRGVFRGLVSDKDTELVIRCLQTAGAAIEKTSDRMTPTRAILTVASWYKCDITIEQVTSLLGQYWIRQDELKSGFLNAEKAHNDLNPILKNPSEGWEAAFYVAPSKLENAELFLNYIGTYQSVGRYNSLEQQSGHLRLMLISMLKVLGFETSANE
jgi:hypothetical protein